jgi:hypothetical protein
VKRAMDDQLEMLAIDRFGIKFPKDKISYVQMTAGMPGHTIWRYYKELVTEVTNRINLAYRSVLNEDLSFPEGKALYDVIEDTCRILWQQNEEIRKERIVKRVDGPGGDPNNPNSLSLRSQLHHPDDDSDSDHEGNGGGLLSGLGNSNNNDDDRLNGRKRSTSQALMNTKPFPGVGKFQPIGFLAFLLMGPPAGEKCWNRFALDAHIEPPPPRQRMSISQRNNSSNNNPMTPNQVNGLHTPGSMMGGGGNRGPYGDDDSPTQQHHNQHHLMNVPGGVSHHGNVHPSQQQQHHSGHHGGSSRSSNGGYDDDDYISPRSAVKRQKTSSSSGLKIMPDGTVSMMGGGGIGQGLGPLQDEENEAIRIFRAETEARAQRLEELKLALSLFPDDENIKAELKQFVDSQRRTSLQHDTSSMNV